MNIAIAAEFERDSMSLPDEAKSKIRCGFEAEFASSIHNEAFADRLAAVLGRGDINVSDNYGASHGSDYTHWSVEYDSSIPTDADHKYKIECVSPIQGPDETVRDMGKSYLSLA